MTPAAVDLLALRHHFERALDHAAILLALAEHELSDQDPAYILRPRQNLQLADHLHLFAFHARKAIELAGLTSFAAQIPLAEPNDVPPRNVIDDLDIPTHTTRDLLFVLNRIVHSQELAVAEANAHRSRLRVAQKGTSPSTWTPAVFSVRSDRDEVDDQHWVEIKHLVAAFLQVVEKVKDLLAFTRAMR